MNPQKAEKKLQLLTHHRVVVVVYIPNEEGFYQNSFYVFKTCLDSLISSVNEGCAITVVNNGSHAKITNLLHDYLSDNKIDTVISHRNNIGKIDALIGAARGVREPLVTLTDADILFVKGWQESVEEIFATFDNVGSVSPIPVRMGLFYGTSSVLKQIAHKKIKFRHIPIPENTIAYNKYLESINWPPNTTADTKWPIVEKDGVRAVIGSGHQVLTMDRDVLFKNVPTNPSLTLVGGDSEYKYVDEPIDLAGKMRLSTYFNFGYHMGNKLEPWMMETEQRNQTIAVKDVSRKPVLSTDVFNTKFTRWAYGLRKKVYKKLFWTFVHKHK